MSILSVILHLTVLSWLCALSFKKEVLCVWMHACIQGSILGTFLMLTEARKRASDHLELGLELVWVLGTKPLSSARATNSLNPWTILNRPHRECHRKILLILVELNKQKSGEISVLARQVWKIAAHPCLYYVTKEKGSLWILVHYYVRNMFQRVGLLGVTQRSSSAYISQYKISNSGSKLLPLFSHFPLTILDQYMALNIKRSLGIFISYSFFCIYKAWWINCILL